MGFSDGLYSVLHYPVISVIDLTKKVGDGVLHISGLNRGTHQDIQLPPNLQNLDVSALVKTGDPVLRIAALSGALAILLGSYGAHALQSNKNCKERRTICEVANRYHFLHTLAMLCAPMSKHPKTAASFMAIGMLLFSGTHYYYAFTGKSNLNKLIPLGTVNLVLGWLFMLL